MDGVNEEFEAVAVKFQISFNKNFTVEKIFQFLKMIQNQQGNEACKKYFQDNLVSYGKYLQVIFAYLIYKGNHKKIKFLTERFLKDYEELTSDHPVRGAAGDPGRRGSDEKTRKHDKEA